MKAALRHRLHTLLSLALRLRSRPIVPAPLGRCVILAPHQDDEALGCAGLIRAHHAAGLSVDVIYLTDGAGSHPGHPLLPPTEIARIRRAEATHAMRLLGLATSSLHFLDAPDGTLAHLSPSATTALAQRLAATLATLSPITLCLPCRDDGSSEHVATFQIAQQSLTLAPINPRPRLLEYPVWSRWSPRLLLRTVLLNRRIWRLDIRPVIDLKRSALAAYVSQFQPAPPWPRAVLPAGFADCFLQSEEFFIER